MTNYLVVSATEVESAVEVATSEAFSEALTVAFPEALEVASEEHDVTIAKTATKINDNFFIVFYFLFIILIIEVQFRFKIQKLLISSKVMEVPQPLPMFSSV